MAIDPKSFEAIADQLPLGRDPASVRRRLEAMEMLLERAIKVPGTDFRIGADAIIGLIPIVGDVIAAAMGAWLVWEAKNLGMSRFQRARMLGNVGFDTVLGLLPIVGDAADLFFKSNSRNMRMIRRHLDKHHPETKLIEGTVLEKR